MIGIQSNTVLVPRSGISTVRLRIAGSVAGRHVAIVRRVLAMRPLATAMVGGGVMGGKSLLMTPPSAYDADTSPADWGGE